MGAAESKTPPPPESKEYLVATYETSTVLVRRYEGSYYANLLSILHKHFPSVPIQSMIIQTDELPVCKGRHIDIPEELWTEVSSQIRDIKVISRPSPVLKPELPAYGS